MWIGQHVFLLKGSCIHSGSVIGAASVVANKKISSNCVIAGNPCKVINNEVFWNEACVHGYTNEETENTSIGTNMEGVFCYVPNEYISFEMLDEVMSKGNTNEKLEELISLNSGKNRFGWKSNVKKV